MKKSNKKILTVIICTIIMFNFCGILNKYSYAENKTNNNTTNTSNSTKSNTSSSNKTTNSSSTNSSNKKSCFRGTYCNSSGFSSNKVR